MRRHLSTLLAAVSLLLCVATCALWVRSYRGGDQLLWTRPEPSARWVTAHLWDQDEPPFPVLRAIEKVAAASCDGRFRLRRVGWVAEDNRGVGGDIGSGTGLFGGGAGDGPPLSADPPPGVSPEPGLAWARGDALRLGLWIGRRHHAVLGFGRERGVWDGGLGGWNDAHWSAYESAAEVPHWAVAALTAGLPVFRLRRWHRSWRRARLAASGRCPSCGYDLRATPDRCPECGRAAVV